MAARPDFDLLTGRLREAGSVVLRRRRSREGEKGCCSGQGTPGACLLSTRFRLLLLMCIIRAYMIISDECARGHGGYASTLALRGTAVDHHQLFVWRNCLRLLAEESGVL